MSDTLNDAGSVGIKVVLDYTHALGQVKDLIAQVAALGDGVMPANLVGILAKAGDELRTMAATQKTLGAEFDEFRKSGEEKASADKMAADAARKVRAEAADANREAKAASAEAIKNGEYLNKTLQQRQRILANIASTMKGMSVADSADPNIESELRKKYSGNAVREYEADRLEAMRQATKLRGDSFSEETKQQAARVSEETRYQAWLKSAQEQDGARRERLVQRQAEGLAWVRQVERDALRERDVARDKAVRDGQAQKAEDQAYQARLREMNVAQVVHAREQRELQEEAAERDRRSAALAKQAVEAEAFRNKTLQTRIGILTQIEALERKSVQGGYGNYAQNGQLRAAVSQKYTGGMAAYASGDRAGDLMGSAATREAVTQSEARAAKMRQEALDVRNTRAEYRELHSAARGLAGPLGLLWLTYGSMIPLAIGAGAAATLKGMLTQGAQFAENMAFVKQLSEDANTPTAELNKQIQGINESLLDMGERGRYGALQLSDAMRVLAQAGFDAGAAFKVLPDVMNLATIGETTPDKAALTIAGSLSSFGLGKNQSGRVADVIAKSAADSQTGVTELMESMKQASSVAEDYGASIEDVGAILTLLAKRNITGSAAGTAARNMLVDLPGRTPKAKAALKELEISMFTAQGQTRAVVDVMGELDAKLSKLSDAKRIDYLRRIFDERGLKAATAIMGNTSEDPNVSLYAKTVADLRNAGDNGGFAARQAAELNTTPIAEYQKAINSLQSNLIRGFNDSEDSVKKFAIQMQDAFRSEEFGDFVSGLAKGATTLANFAASMGPLINVGTQAALVYGGLKLTILGIMTTYRAYVAVTGAAALATQVMTGAQIASTMTTRAGSVANTAFTATLGNATVAAYGLRAALGPVAMGLAVVAGAWALLASQEDKKPKFKFDVDKSADNEQYNGMNKRFSQGYNAIAEDLLRGKDAASGTLADLDAKLTEGTRRLADERKHILDKEGQDSVAARQVQEDGARKFNEELATLATKRLKSEGDERQKLSDLLAKIADEDVRIHDLSMQTLVMNNAEQTAKLIADAKNVGWAWEDTWDTVKNFWTFNKLQRVEDAGTRERRGTEGVAQLITQTQDKLTESNGLNRQDDDNRIRLMGYLKAYEGMAGANQDIVAKARDNLALQKKIADEKIRGNREEQARATRPRPDGGLPEKADTGRKGREARAIVDQTAYNLSRQELEIAKESTKQWGETLAIRQKLGLASTEALYSRQLELRLAQEEKQLTADLAKSDLDIAAARKAELDANKAAGQRKGAGSQTTEEYETLSRIAKANRIEMERNRDILVEQSRNTSDILRLNYEADFVNRELGRLGVQYNTVLNARSTILGSLNTLYGSSEGYDTRALLNASEAATIDKARVEQFKQMNELADSPEWQRQLATDARRLDLATRLLEMRREENRLLFDRARSTEEYGTATMNALHDSITELKRQRTVFVDDVVNGLSSGSQSAWGGLAGFARDPSGYEKQNGSPGVKFFADMGNGIFDSIAGSLSKSMTQSMMTGLQSTFQSLGFTSDADRVRAEAEGLIATNASITAEQLSVQIPDLLRQLIAATERRGTAVESQRDGMYVPGLGTTANGDRANPREAFGALGKYSDPKDAKQAVLGIGNAATESARQFDIMRQKSATAFEFMGMNSTQTFGLMYMGVNSFAQGGARAFAKFAATAIAQLLAVYAIQKIVGMAVGSPLSVGNTGNAPMLSAGVAGNASPYAFGAIGGGQKFADGTGFVRKEGFISGPGGPRDDMIPAMVSHGEAVLNARAVSRIGSRQIDAWNKGVMNVQKYADGYVPPGRAAQTSSSVGTMNLTFNLGQGQAGAAVSAGGGGVDQAAMVSEMESAVLGIYMKHSRQGGAIHTRTTQIAQGR